MKVAIYTLGCKVNQYESNVIAGQFVARGYKLVDYNQTADVYVVNTCSVTHIAERKSRQYINRAKRENPNSIIAVTGCYSQISNDTFKEMKNVDIVVGINKKYEIVEAVDEFTKKQKIFDILEYDHLSAYIEAPCLPKVRDRIRAFIKIQEGCNRFCSYCIIPYARGKVRSRSLKAIVEEAKSFIKSGYKELVLTGINTALYGAEKNFNDLCLKEYPQYREGDYSGIEIVINELNNLDGDFRIRLSSLEPTVVNSEYVKRLMKYDKLCHHLHMSLQSGSNKILKSMNRKYTIDEYINMAKTLREFDPFFGISTDIIVGFPGENATDFEDGTLKIVKEVGFTRVHGFPFSPRPLTKAWDLKENISSSEKKNRMDKLMAVSQYILDEFIAKSIGTEQTILFEEIIDIDGEKFYTGYTDNYLKAYLSVTSNDTCILNQFIKCTITNKFQDGIKVRR